MWSLCPHLPGEETHHFSKTPHFSLIKITSEGPWPSNVLSGSQCVLGYFECPGNLVLSDSEPRPHSCIDWSCPCPSPHSPGLSATRFSSWGLKRKEISETEFVPRKSTNSFDALTSHNILNDKSDGNTWWLNREFELIVELRQQQVMAQRLSHLHDPAMRLSSSHQRLSHLHDPAKRIVIESSESF